MLTTYTIRVVYVILCLFMVYFVEILNVCLVLDSL